MRDRCTGGPYTAAVAPIEGDIVALSDGSIWIVKGCIHPPEGVVAIPRFVGGRRVKRAGESLAITRRFYRHYIRFVKEIGCEVPVLPWVDVKLYVSAYDRTLSIIRKAERGPEHVRRAVELIRLLKDACGLTCWLTGSALGLYPSSSRSPDVDLLCFDSADALSCLKRLRAEGLLRNLTPKSFLNEAFSVGEILHPNLLTLLATRRVTQGVFKGVKYTLRLVNCRRVERASGPYEITLLLNGTAILLRSGDYRFPAIYEAELLHPMAGVRKALLLTHRVRLTELPAGTVVLGTAVLHLKLGRGRYWVINFDLPPARIDALVLGQQLSSNQPVV